ncbi:MAG: endonuclease [Flavobacteriaceae bacterium]
MKKITLLVLLCLPTFLFAQTPSYYNNVNLSLTGTSLKNELATKIISTHTRNLSYSQVWSSSKITDLDPSNNANVLLIYGYNDNDGDSKTDRSRSKNRNGGGSTDWNREHTYAKSLGTPNLGTSGPGSDAHHLRPADTRFNSTRNNHKFASGSGNAKITGGGWYPGDEWKGDVARMMMYMYVRYGNRCLPTNVGIGSSSSTPDAMISLFLQWNAQDPVSQFEINRNTYHGSSSNQYAQGNRNPFIDNPAFATQIWGGPQAENLFNGSGGGSGTDTQDPTRPTGVVASNISQTSLTLNWSASSDNFGVTGYRVYRGTSLLGSVSGTAANITGLSAGSTYSFRVRAFDAAGNLSSSSTTYYTRTLASSGGGGGGSSSNLFISEYVEGSSYNKAIEIANTTGGSVSLSGYKLKKQSNGSGSWSSGFSLSGNLSSGDVYVVANSNASSGVTSSSDVTTSNSALSFNGNDAVGLFKNGTLIDIVGNFNGGSSYFGKDMTLRRKSSVTSPSTTFNKTGEWDQFSSNTFNGLGSHSGTSGGGGNGGGSTTVLFDHSFESGWDGWQDGGSDCYRIRSSSKAYDGSYSIRIRDNSGTGSAMTSQSYNVSSYSNLEVKFNFYSYSMENNEDFWLRFYDGSTWRTVKRFVRGTDFNNNAFSQGTVNISSSAYNFPSNAKFRFQCDASSNADIIYMDNIKVTATSGSSKTENPIDSVVELLSFNADEDLIEDLIVYHKPYQRSINVKTELDIEDSSIDVHITLVTIQGKMVSQTRLTDVRTEFFDKDIDVSELSKGIYFLTIVTSNGEKQMKKVLIN